MPSAVVAITGASGARYGVRLVEQLSLAGWEIDLIVSKAGEINLKLECGIGASELNEIEGVSIHIMRILLPDRPLGLHCMTPM